MADYEDFGNSHLTMFLTRSSILKPNIFSNDRTMSWDGEIVILRNKQQPKQSYVGKIPVQVKTRGVENFNQEFSSFDFEIADLRNYSLSGGVVVFLIEVMNFACKIFYRPLLPSDLKDILSKYGNQATRAIQLKFLDESTTTEIENELQTFLINVRKQYSNLDYSITLDEVSEFSFYAVTDAIPFDDYLLKRPFPIPMYAKKSPIDIEYYFDNVHVTSVSHTVNKPVSINNKVFYNSYELIKTKDNITIKFGKKIFIDTTLNGLSIELSGTILERITDCEFLIELFKYKEISLAIDNSSYLKIQEIKNEGELKSNTEKILQNLNEILQLLEIFKVNPLSLELSQNGSEQLDIQSLINLDQLIKVFIYHEKPSILPDKQGFHILKISNIHLGIFIYQVDGAYIVRDLFSNLDDLHFSASTINGVRIDISPYIFISVKDLQLATNLDLDLIISSIKKCEPNEDYINLVNLFGLGLINTYDLTNREEFLIGALEIFDWLLSFENNNIISRLNMLQIIRRSRSFTDDEFTELNKMREKFTENDEWVCGIDILLENKAEARVRFSKLPEIIKTEFVKFPIYRFAIKNNILK